MMPTTHLEETSSPVEEDVHYTVLVRLPFARGAFVDPPPVEWNAERDRELWDLLSRSSAKGQDLDWNALAERFDVTLAFLSQQAAWLYERQLSQVRAQLRKVNKPASVGTPSTPGSASGSVIKTGGYATTRIGSGGSRVPSALSHRSRDRNPSQGEEAMKEQRASKNSPLSRRSSANTITHMPTHSPPIKQRSSLEIHSSFQQRRPSREPTRQSVETSPKYGRPSMERLSSSSAIDSSSSSDSDTGHGMTRSRAFARRPRYATARSNLNALSDADEEGEDSPLFLPFSDARSTTTPPPSDPGATLRVDPNSTAERGPAGAMAKGKAGALPQTTYSSSSSAQSQAQSHNQRPPSRPSALSPQQRRIAKEAGSDGARSMGSSFSDLDDASVTQSALEEALAGEMQHGGVASKMSTISQALRSRYM